MELRDCLIALAREEIEKKTFGVTEQLLEVLNVVRVDGEVQIAHIDIDEDNNYAVIYIPIEGERFFIDISFRLTPEPHIFWVSHEDCHHIYFSVTSKKLNFEELSRYTKLIPMEGWSK